MSIYPVRIREWYLEGQAFGSEIPTLRSILKYIPCETCKGKIAWDNGWVDHSITFGVGRGWCSEKCLNGEVTGDE